MPAKPFYITTSWDDGHPHDMRLAELLVKHGLAATFYVPIFSRRMLLNAAEIRRLSSTFEIGGHTVTHCDLRSLPYSASCNEIGHCKEALEQITSLPCRSFCFPLGRYRRGHIAQLKFIGFTVARTAELMSLDFPRLHGGIAVMPTTIQAAPAGAATFFKNAAKRLRPENFMRWERFRGDNWVATLDAVLAFAADHGGVVHLWGHSWEIEQNNDWVNLDRALSLLAQYRVRARFTSNGELWNLLSQTSPLPGAADGAQATTSPTPFLRDLAGVEYESPSRA